MNNYQKTILLDLLKNRKIFNEHIIEKLNQTIIHNNNWVLPIALKDGNEKVIKSIYEVVRDAKKDIDVKQNDLTEVNNLIDEINSFV